jgi:hypothetical protein
MDVADPHSNAKKGQQVRVVKLRMAPPPGTMGQAHVESMDGKFLGMVCVNSLRPRGTHVNPGRMRTFEQHGRDGGTVAYRFGRFRVTSAMPGALIGDGRIYRGDDVVPDPDELSGMFPPRTASACAREEQRVAVPQGNISAAILLALAQNSRNPAFSRANKGETTTIPFSRSLRVVNLEQLPRGIGAGYLVVIPGAPGEWVAKRWSRKKPKLTGIEHAIVMPKRGKNPPLIL